MHFNSLSNIVFLGVVLALQARAGPAFPHITKGDFSIIQGSTGTAAPSALLATPPTVGPFVPTAANLIVNTTVAQGVDAALGWIFDTVPGVTDGSPVFDASAFNDCHWPDLTDFCGFGSGFWLAGVIDSSVLGTYAARWTIDYGQSTQLARLCYANGYIRRLVASSLVPSEIQVVISGHFGFIDTRLKSELK
ncbi:hypothetical protein C8R45DRAFT_933927 [Mycena sanguinolenta]|nr:hypothetical protein C8R45DRAFT_933927 [Mycena sanguinolenta]